MAENATAKAMRKLADGAVGLAAKGGVALDYTPGSIDSLERYLSELHDYGNGDCWRGDDQAPSGFFRLRLPQGEGPGPPAWWEERPARPGSHRTPRCSSRRPRRWVLGVRSPSL